MTVGNNDDFWDLKNRIRLEYMKVVIYELTGGTRMKCSRVITLSNRRTNF